MGYVCVISLNLYGFDKELARLISSPLKSLLLLGSQQEFLPVVLLHEADEGLCDVPVADPRPCEHVVGAVRGILLSGEDCPKSSSSEKRHCSTSI